MAALALVVAAGCQPNDASDFSYYEERISPILVGGCTRSPSGGGCHIPLENGTALGNLDMTSFDSLMRRDDVLAAYGPYSVGPLLLKAGDPIDVQVETFDADNRFISITTDIRHNNGTTINQGASAYAQLKQWIEAGHARTGVPDETLTQSEGPCSVVPGHHPLYDPGLADRVGGLYNSFRSDVEPVLVETCAGTTCHGNTIADLYITCGGDDALSRWNFWVAVQHITTPASTSGLLRRPLSTYRGGVFHEGGNIFASAEDPTYEVIRAWADQLVEEHPEAIAPPTEISEGLRYFANRVQPTMVRKGCMFLNCHSPSMFHDLRLRGGAQGHFSRIATYNNWEISRLMLALDASDPNESRIIAKNLFPPEQVPGSPGIFHRGGSLFEDFGMSGGAPNLASPDECAAFDLDNGDLNTIPAYCTMVRWHQIERQEAIDAGEIFPDTEIVRSVAWISRPTGVGSPGDFNTFRAGADLMLAPAMVDATTSDLTLGAASSVLGGCGLTAASTDLRGLAVNWSGTRLAFGARGSASEPFRLYEMNVDGSGCAPIAGVAAASNEVNGILTHDFDPAYAADGRLVFASTRGNLDGAILGQEGPTLTPHAMQPNANLYVFDGSAVRQLTFLLNHELSPSFMTDGRIIMSAEKRALDFYELSGRRQNLDGGDYHPLFAQRQTVGYEMASEIIELLDRDFALVAAPRDAADGAGRIVVVNRSIGPDQDEPNPAGGYYIASQRFPTGAVSGGSGAYRSPAALPTGRILVSCDQGAADLTSGGYDFDLCELDKDSGAIRSIGGAAGRADIEAVPIFARAPREVFFSRPDEANGATYIDSGAADARINVVDFPLLATLLFENTRMGRAIDYSIGGFDVIAEYPPPASARIGDFGSTGGNVETDSIGMYYRNAVVLGHVGLNPDGSAHFGVSRGGLPISLAPTTAGGDPLMFSDGAPFTGIMFQREQMQFYPGERINQSFRRELFNGACAVCHGSISGRELDVAVDVDVLTRASEAASNEQDPSVF